MSSPKKAAARPEELDVWGPSSSYTHKHDLSSNNLTLVYSCPWKLPNFETFLCVTDCSTAFAFLPSVRLEFLN